MKKNYFKNLMQVSLLLGAAFVISSCDDVIGQEDNPVASYVQWEAKTPKSIELTLGIAGKETATVKAVAVSSVVIVYESENTEIAKVDPVTGVITAVGVGETNIKAVVSGASAAGQSVFIPEEIKIPVIVKDGKAKLTRVKDEVIEFTANVDSVIDLTKLFTAYPKIGTGDDESAIAFEAFTYDYNVGTKKYQYNAYSGNKTTLGLLTSAAKKFEVGAELKNTDITKSGISDTLYIVAELQAATVSPTYVFPAKTATEAEKDIVKDTVKIVINKSIAFINKDGKREILTADKYKELDLTKTSAIEAGTYFVTKAPSSTPSAATDIKGDVTLIFKNTINAQLQNLDDKTDKATLNIFGEAIKDTKAAEYKAWSPTISLTKLPSAITNFGEINIYTGTITVNGKTRVKDINVYGGTLQNTTAYTNAFDLTGTLTINGGGKVIAKGTASEAYAIVGNVVLNKGTLEAENADYRAINGTLTAGEGFEFLQGDTSDKSKATKIEGTTSTRKYIWGQAVAVPKK